MTDQRRCLLILHQDIILSNGPSHLSSQNHDEDWCTCACIYTHWLRLRKHASGNLPSTHETLKILHQASRQCHISGLRLMSYTFFKTSTPDSPFQARTSFCPVRSYVAWNWLKLQRLAWAVNHLQMKASYIQDSQIWSFDYYTMFCIHIVYIRKRARNTSILHGLPNYIHDVAKDASSKIQKYETSSSHCICHLPTDHRGHHFAIYGTRVDSLSTSVRYAYEFDKKNYVSDINMLFHITLCVMLLLLDKNIGVN